MGFMPVRALLRDINDVPKGVVLVAYKYRGTIQHAEPETTRAPRTATTNNTEMCGTATGYRRHQRHGTTACQPCKDAIAELGRKLRKATPLYGTYRADKCGTYAGYHRHRRYRVPPCQACRDANTQYMSDLRARKAA